MTIYEYLISRNINELSHLIYKNCDTYDSPWLRWWNENYCCKCEPITVNADYLNRDIECCWCELNDNKCKYFPEQNVIPGTKQIIGMWLEQEIEQYANYSI